VELVVEPERVETVVAAAPVAAETAAVVVAAATVGVDTDRSSPLRGGARRAGCLV
jgi:hypothetical protein